MGAQEEATFGHLSHLEMGLSLKNHHFLKTLQHAEFNFKNSAFFYLGIMQKGIKKLLLWDLESAEVSDTKYGSLVMEVMKVSCQLPFWERRPLDSIFTRE